MKLVTKQYIALETLKSIQVLRDQLKHAHELELANIHERLMNLYACLSVVDLLEIISEVETKEAA